MIAESRNVFTMTSYLSIFIEEEEDEIKVGSSKDGSVKCIPVESSVKDETAKEQF
jgi:hypothetical protein